MADIGTSWLKEHPLWEFTSPPPIRAGYTYRRTKYGRLVEKVKQLAQENQRLQATVQKYVSERDAAIARVNELQALVTELQQERNHFQTTVQRYVSERDAAIAKAAKVEQLEALVAQLKRQNEQLQTIIQTALQERDAALKRVRELEQRIPGIKKRVDILDNIIRQIAVKVGVSL